MANSANANIFTFSNRTGPTAVYLRAASSCRTEPLPPSFPRSGAVELCRSLHRVTFNTLSALIVSPWLRGRAGANGAIPSLSVSFRIRRNLRANYLDFLRPASPCWFTPLLAAKKNKPFPLNQLPRIISHREKLPILSYDNFFPPSLLFLADLSFLLTVPDGGRNATACQSCWISSAKRAGISCSKTRRQSLTAVRVCAWDEE